MLILTCFIKKDQEKCITIAVKALIYSSFSNIVIVMYSLSMSDSMVFGTHFLGLAVVNLFSRLGLDEIIQRGAAKGWWKQVKRR